MLFTVYTTLHGFLFCLEDIKYANEFSFYRLLFLVVAKSETDRTRRYSTLLYFFRGDFS